MSQVAQIEYDRMIMQKEKQKQMSHLEDEAHLAKIKSQADADFYLIQKQSESNKVRVCTVVIIAGIISIKFNWQNGSNFGDLNSQHCIYIL